MENSYLSDLTKLVWSHQVLLLCECCRFVPLLLEKGMYDY
jgi:hypothetical protein